MVGWVDLDLKWWWEQMWSLIFRSFKLLTSDQMQTGPMWPCETLPSPDDSWEKLQQTSATLSAE